MSPEQKLLHFERNNSLLDNIMREDIRLVYTFEKRLGSGAFGTVRMAYKQVNPGKKFAIKSMKRETLVGEEADLKNELGILLATDHPNIVKLNEIYLDHFYIHLVTELLEGGEADPQKEPTKKYSE